ncbi:MAG: hypothetical protein WCA77_03795 [Thermoplasmata archaeon]
MSHVVKIPRSPGTTGAKEGTGPSDVSVQGPFIPNHGGRVRGIRVFLIFAGAVTVMFLAFVELTVSSSAAGLRQDLPGLVALSLVWVAFLFVNWSLTLHRVPRGVWRTPESYIVRDRYGRTVRFPREGLRATVLQRYPASSFFPEATELVRLECPHGPRATYLVTSDLLSA